MKIGELIKFIDWLSKITIWTPDCGDEEDAEPAYSGTVMDMPWYFMDYTIGRVDRDTEEPIYIGMEHKENKNKDSYEPIMVINAYNEKETD